MTREEAIGLLIIQKLMLSDPVSGEPISDLYTATDMAIKALEQEPCEEFINVPRKALKFRATNFVGYNVEWLKKHWQMEMDIVCGVKPCEDAISREDAISAISTDYVTAVKNLEHLPPVTPSRRKGHWIKKYSGYECSECAIKSRSKSDFCQYCGAEMEESEVAE